MHNTGNGKIFSIQNIAENFLIRNYLKQLLLQHDVKITVRCSKRLQNNIV